MLSKNQIKFITSLKQKKFRTTGGLFVAEGHKVVGELLNSQYEPEKIYSVAPSVFLDSFSEKTVFISGKELKKISFLSNPDNVVALFRIAHPKTLPKKGLILALDSIRDPGNLGTIIRLCDWFGVESVVCSKDTVDCYNPKVIQATMGAIARVKVHYTDMTYFLNQTTLPVYGAMADSTAVYNMSLCSNAILVMGNESNGISNAVKPLLTHGIGIPRFGKYQQAESLNVSTATAILLNEFRRTDGKSYK